MIKQKEPPWCFFRAISLETDSILVFFSFQPIVVIKKSRTSSKVDSFDSVGLPSTRTIQYIPSWKLTYPIFKKGTFESMMFRTSRSVGYVLLPWWVPFLQIPHLPGSYEVNVSWNWPSITSYPRTPGEMTVPFVWLQIRELFPVETGELKLGSWCAHIYSEWSRCDTTKLPRKVGGECVCIQLCFCLDFRNSPLWLK